MQGRTRARYLAARLGVALREARLAVRMTQTQVALAAGVSQGWISELERGQGATGSIESWARSPPPSMTSWRPSCSMQPPRIGRAIMSTSVASTSSSNVRRPGGG